MLTPYPEQSKYFVLSEPDSHPMQAFLNEPRDDHEEQDQSERSWINGKTHWLITHQLKSRIIWLSFYKIKILRVERFTIEHVHFCEDQSLREEDLGLRWKLNVDETTKNDDLHGVEQTP